MTVFLYSMAAMFALDVIGRLIRLKDHDHTRKPWEEAINAVSNMAVLVWTVVLIAGGAK